MLVLESLKCDYCHKQCEYGPMKTGMPKYSFGMPILCETSGTLKCAQCFSSEPTCEKCIGNGCFVRSFGLSMATMIATITCPDELKLLDFGAWNPFRCRECIVEYTVEEHALIDSADAKPFVRCARCGTFEGNHFLHGRYLAVMKELHSYFAQREFIPQKNTTAAWMFTNKRLLFCFSCKSKRGSAITNSGNFSCEDCFETSMEQPKISLGEEWRRWLGILFQLPNISELHQLSYSKWTPFRCRICSVAFSENSEDFPIFHYDSSDARKNKFSCNKCHLAKRCSCSERFQIVRATFLEEFVKEFKRLFKDEAIERVIPHEIEMLNKETQTEEQIKIKLLDRETQWDEKVRVSEQLQKDTKRMATQGRNTVIARKSRCLCGTEDKVEELHRCVSCAILDVCCRCVIKNHKNHKLVNMLGERIHHFIVNNKRKQFAKSDNWKRTLNKLDVQIDTAKEELVKHLHVLYQHADTEDVELVESTIAKTDLSSLRQFLKNARTAREKLTLHVETRLQSMPSTGSEELLHEIKLPPAAATVNERKLRIVRTASCLCGTEDSVEELYQCVRCAMPDVCPRCAMKFHAGHQFVNMLGEQIKNAVDVEQRDQFAKLNNWNSDLNRLDGQTKALMQELGELLQQAYQKASTSEDPLLVERILTKCDMESLKAAIKVTRNTRKQFTRKTGKHLRTITINESNWSDED